MRLRTLAYLYGWRVKAHPIQETLAGAGIAIGVALLFAVQVANSSVTGSVKQLVGAIAGDAQVELGARDDQGFDTRVLMAVRAVPGVKAAAPLLERRAMIRGPSGSASLLLIGTDPSLKALRGTVAQRLPSREAFPPDGGVVLPDGVARRVGVHAAGVVTLQSAGRSTRLRVVSTLAADQVGSLTESNVAFVPLRWMQRLVGSPAQVTRVFVRVDTGQEAGVRSRLERVAAGRFGVGPADSTLRRLKGVMAPNDQSTMLIAVIGVMLLAFNAMLLTMPVRRRFVVELRTAGFTPVQVVVTLACQAFALGVLASAAGLVLGAVLSRELFGSIPTYLSFTFPVGTQGVVPLSAVLIASGAGVAASVLAASRAFADLHPSRAIDAVYQEQGDVGEELSGTLRRRLVFAAGALAVVALSLAMAVPSTTMLAVAALAGSVLCMVPTIFSILVRLMDAVARRLRKNMLVVALIGAQSTMTRSIAVAAIAAIAVFGSITSGGAREDLIRGLFAGYSDHVGTADVWVTSAGRSLTTDSFQISPRQLARLRRDPALASVRVYQGGMHDIGGRRIWVIARPRDDRQLIPASQLRDGDLASATARMRRSGWVSLSTSLAQRYEVGIGDAFMLPTPTGPRRFRVAAVTTNLSWGPGAVILNTHDYRRAWRSTAPSAIEIDTRAGVTPTEGRRAAERVLGRDAGYDIQTADALEAEFQGVLVEGLAPLQRTSMLVLIFAALALATAFGAAAWHRRDLLAAYKVQGFNARQLRRIVRLEALTVLVLGAALGIVTGHIGHVLCDRWLEMTTGFPAPFKPQLGVAVESVGVVVFFATAIITVPGYLAARVPPGLLGLRK